VTVMIEDSARNTVGAWVQEAVNAGVASGVVLSPFTTPRVGNRYKPSARDLVRRLLDGGAEVWLDPETHALQMPSVGDFRYYDDWPLWPGPKGRLDSEADIRGHVESVFEAQDYLGLPHLAPTILLHAPQSATSQSALEMARIATELDPDCRLAIAGDPGFWASARALDAHIGGLAQLEPGSWTVTVVRNLPLLPVQAIPEEIHGVCRTVRALSDDGPVHVSHGDLAALPALAAGANTVGTGWDTRQRVSAYASYEQRDASAEGGNWFQQITFGGLLSQLTQGESAIVVQQDAPLAHRLTPGNVAPGPKEAFMHHARILADVSNALRQRSPVDAHHYLRDMYQSSRADWPAVAAALGVQSRADAWLAGVESGHALYGRTEGF